MAYRDTISGHAKVIHYWPMDEVSGTALEALVGAVDLTPNEGTLDTTGQVVGGAVYSDGADEG